MTGQHDAVSALERLRAPEKQAKAGRYLLLVFLAAFAVPAFLVATTGNAGALPGTQSIRTAYPYKTLVDRLEKAVTANRMGVVSRASATLGARAALKKEIPGNMVIGVFHPRFAVRMLEASIPAGIEAPLRFYITENNDHTATLTWRKPSATFAPYGSAKLDAMARELDVIFAKIAADATAKK